MSNRKDFLWESSTYRSTFVQGTLEPVKGFKLDIAESFWFVGLSLLDDFGTSGLSKTKVNLNQA